MFCCINCGARSDVTSCCPMARETGKTNRCETPTLRYHDSCIALEPRKELHNICHELRRVTWTCGLFRPSPLNLLMHLEVRRRNEIAICRFWEVSNNTQTTSQILTTQCTLQGTRTASPQRPLSLLPMGGSIAARTFLSVMKAPCGHTVLPFGTHNERDGVSRVLWAEPRRTAHSKQVSIVLSSTSSVNLFSINFRVSLTKFFLCAAFSRS